MKTRRRSVWLTAIAVAGSVALYGCGGGSSPDTTPYGQADVDKAAQDAAAAAQAAVEARASAIAAAEAAQAAAEQAATDATTAAGNAANAATTAADNAMAESFDVAAATAAAAAATAAAKDAETASTAAAAANARAAAVAHDDPAVMAAKAAAAAAAMAAEMAAGNAEASAAAATASVTVAMQLEAQMMADDEQTATDATNADLAAKHATDAEIYAGRAGEAADAARALATGVRGGMDPDVAAVSAFVDTARHWEGKTRESKDLADGVSVEGNADVMISQEAAKTAAMNAATSVNQAMGAVIAVQGYADSEATATDRDAVATANAHVEVLRSLLGWIVGADADDVSSTTAIAGTAADLAPRLADDALADGGHDSQATNERVAEMSELVASSAAIRTEVDAEFAKANADYDSAVPLFEDGRMNVAGAEVTGADDLASGGIVRTGENGVNTRAFMVNGHTLQSSETIESRNALDFIGRNRVVTTAGHLANDNGVVTQYTTEAIEYYKWQSEYTRTGANVPEAEPAVRGLYEYMTFGSWTMVDPGAQAFPSDVIGPLADVEGSSARRMAQGGTFVFADRDMLWKRTDGAGVTAFYEGEHTSVYYEKFDDNENPDVFTQSGPATLSVDFDANTVAARIYRRWFVSSTSGYVFSELYSVNGMTLNDDSTISAGESATFTAGDWMESSSVPTAAPQVRVRRAAGGIFGPDAEEIGLTLYSSGSSPSGASQPGTIRINTAVGGRHSAHQTAQ